jgi:hypothetical protein
MRQKVIVHNLRFAVCLDKNTSSLIIPEFKDFKGKNVSKLGIRLICILEKKIIFLQSVFPFDNFLVFISDFFEYFYSRFFILLLRLNVFYFLLKSPR